MIACGRQTLLGEIPKQNTVANASWRAPMLLDGPQPFKLAIGELQVLPSRDASARRGGAISGLDSLTGPAVKTEQKVHQPAVKTQQKVRQPAVAIDRKVRLAFSKTPLRKVQNL